MTAKKTVAIADDSTTTSMLFSLLLQRMGFHIRTARNGVELLGLVKREAPDVILLDLNMPVMDGRTALRILHQEPSFSAIPVVVVTVESSPAVREECMRLGCAGFLPKPVRLSDLYEHLQACFAGRGKVRRSIRAPFPRPVQVFAGGETLCYPAANLSERGIFLLSTRPYAAGTSLVVALPFDDGEEHLFTGVVVHECGPAGAEPSRASGMGIEFTQMSPQARVALRTLVRRLLLEGIDRPAVSALRLDDEETRRPGL
jgi:CheY-like chemotaxis protein